jgi:hypothetical protein
MKLRAHSLYIAKQHSPVPAFTALLSELAYRIMHHSIQKRSRKCWISTLLVLFFAPNRKFPRLTLERLNVSIQSTKIYFQYLFLKLFFGAAVVANKKEFTLNKHYPKELVDD